MAGLLAGASILSGLASGVGSYLGAREQSKEAKRNQRYLRAQGNAAIKNIRENRDAALNQYQNALNQSQASRLAGMYGSQDYLNQGFDASGRSLSHGYGQAIGTTQQYGDRALQALMQGRDAGAASLSPYARLGTSGVAGLESLMANPQAALENSPGYQFRLAQGQRALERSAAARGGSLSGAQLKSLQGYGQGMASQEYDNMFNRYSQMAGMGQNASTNLSNLYQQYGTNAANLQTGMGSQIGAYQANLGTGQANLDQARGSALANLYGGTYNALAGDQMTTGQMAGNAYQNAGANIANARMGTGSAVTSQSAANPYAAGITGMTNAFNQGLGNLAFMYAAQPQQATWQPPIQQQQFNPQQLSDYYNYAGGMY